MEGEAVPSQKNLQSSFMCNAITNNMDASAKLDLSDSWRFFRGRISRRVLCAADAPAGETVSLPHSWNMTDTFQPGVRYYQGTGAYLRSFLCPPEFSSGRIWLCSEGFYGTGKVWINGRLAGNVNGQFLGFRLPVENLLRCGEENQIACRLTNRCGNRELPGIRYPDFLLHGGLAGRVWLEKTGDCYLDDNLTHVHAFAGDSPHVNASVCVVNAGKSNANAVVTWTLKTLAGDVFSSEKSGVVPVGGGSRKALNIELPAPDVLLWSDKSPQRYIFEAVLLIENCPVDAVSRRIGFRTAEFRPGEGFFLNGERLLLAGCNRHESMPGCGNALSPEQHRADAAAIREMGLNFVRLSHYPQSPAFLDACDEMGLLVYAELASWKSVRGGSWLRKAQQQFSDMIRRDRHHPSVIIWGMGNEGRHRKAYDVLSALARQHDPSRPVIYAENHLYRARRKKTTGLPDVWGCNYELDALAEGCQAAKLRCVIVSECSNAPYARRGDLEAERRQIDQLAADLPRIEEVPFAAGFAIWCFSDYATLRKARYLRYSGVVDAWREPKLAAYWLRARYSCEPFIKLAADWQPVNETSNALRRVDLFMTVSAAEIRINKRIVMTVEGRGHHLLQIPFEAGRLEAVALNEADLFDVIETSGPAARLELKKLDGQSGMLQLEVLDGNGRLVRNWDGEVDLGANGAVCAFPYKAGKVLVAGGTARIPFAAGSASQKSKLRVFTEELAPAEIGLNDE